MSRSGKVLIWCGDQANHIALANKAAERFNVVGIVLESKGAVKKKALAVRFKGLINKVLNKLRFHAIDKAWTDMISHFKTKYTKLPDSVEVLKVKNINSQEVLSFSNRLGADIIMVSGTRLIKDEILKKAKTRVGIVNLHTGLSPYVKGGPNCTNWCLANDTFHMIGNTVMWIDAGIDTGNIIATDTVNFTGDEDLSDIQVQVMESAHKLYLDTVVKMLEDPEAAPSVPQSSIAEGELYLTRMWTAERKGALLKNISDGRFKEVISSEKYKKEKAQLRTVNQME